MKTKLFFILLVMMMSSQNANAVVIHQDGICYETISIDDLTLEVLGFVTGQEKTDLVIPEYVNYNGRDFMVVKIGYSAFSSSIIERITLPNTLVSIESQAFYKSNLTELNIPNSVQTIGEGVAGSCDRLQTLRIGNGIKDIPQWSFKMCKNLKYVYIPNSVNNIDRDALCYMDNVETLIIEDGPNKINKTCKSGKDVTYNMGGWPSGIPGGSIKGADIPLFAMCKINNLYIGRNMTETIISSKSAMPRPVNVTVGPRVTNLNGIFCDYDVQRIKLITPNPPAINTITDYSYMNIQVFVPKGSLATYKANSTWKKFWNIEEYDSNCEAPDITYENGTLKLTSKTEGAICYCTITDTDIVTEAEVSALFLSGTYNIEAYAMLNGTKSERSYATLSWIDNTFTSADVNTPLLEAKRPVIVKSRNQEIEITGLNEGEQVDFYSINGMHIASTSAYGNKATCHLSVEAGDVVIARIGNNSIKFVVK